MRVLRDDKAAAGARWFLMVLLSGIGIFAIATGIITSLPMPPSLWPAIAIGGGFAGGLIVGALSRGLLRGILCGLVSATLGPVLCYVIMYFYGGYYSVAVGDGIKMGLSTARLLGVPAAFGAVLGALVVKKKIKQESAEVSS